MSKQNKQIITLAFSGGLDTSFCAAWLQQERDADVVTCCVDTGGFGGEEELAAIEDRALSLGAVAHHTVDARQVVYERFVSYIIKGNVLRGGVYPVSVAAERTAQAEAVVDIARQVGAQGVAHGSTGAGNDQVRFDIALATLAPELAIHAPIRELAMSREQESTWLIEHGFPVDEKVIAYSFNEGLFGTTIGGTETHDGWAMPPESAYTITRPQETAADTAEEVVLGFEQGLPVSLDGERLGGVQLVGALNARCAAHGVGRGIHVGDTILGVKGRIAFEAPAPLVLITAHRELQKLVSTKWQSMGCEQAGSSYGMLLHEGLYYDPAVRDLEALLDSANTRVTGEVRVRLFKGMHTVVGARSPHSLLGKGATYGEGALGWDGAEAAGFAKLHGMQSTLAMQAHQATTVAPLQESES